MLRHVTAGWTDRYSQIPWYSKQGTVGGVIRIVSFLHPTSLASRMMGRNVRSAQSSVEKLAANQMTRYRVSPLQCSVPAVLEKFPAMSIATRDLQYSSRRKLIKGTTGG
jgi:hypothetical protein